MYRSLLQIITDFGDSAVLGLMALAGSFYLWKIRCRKSAIVLLAAFCFAGFLIGFVKLLFFGCATSSRWADLKSPSGHAALSTAVFGTYGLIIARRLGSRRHQLCAGLMAAAIILAIAFTRVYLGYHTISEVLFGFTVGLIVLLSVSAILFKDRQEAIDRHADVRELLIYAFLAGILFHGLRFPGEKLIHLLALKLGSYGHMC